MKTFRFFSRLCLLLCLLITTATIASALEKPNIIIFYVDDLGWQDVGLNDLDDECPYETPNLDKLAAMGMNFTQAYSPAPSCSPSRAGIITGQHPAQLGITHVYLGKVTEGRPKEQFLSPYLDQHLNFDHLTLADAMKGNGYKTGHAGKWHIGPSADNYGFEFVDHSRGVHRGMKDRTKDFSTAKDKQYPLSQEKYAPFSDKKPNGISYPYDQLTESALQFMAESKSEPFFLNMWHWMVHWPVITRNGELLEYYCDKMGQPFPPKDGDMTLPGQQNPYFAAMVTTVDWSLGRVMDYLKNTDDPRNPGKKLSETTYIFFSSDNGGAEKKAAEIISDNLPLKYGKTHTEEGGIRVPMVVAGPGVTKGSQFDGLVNQLDYFPTILQVTTSSIAPEHKKLLSGADISGVLTGASETILNSKGKERTHLFWHYPHGGGSMKSSIRQGDFKLYQHAQAGSYELYRLYQDGARNDLEEMINVIDDPQYAELAKGLKSRLDAELKAHNAQGPYLNPTFKNNTLQAASITSSTLSTLSTLSDKQASLTLDPKGPGIAQAYVIYLPSPDAPEKKHRNETGIDTSAPQIGVKYPVQISDKGYRVTATIPEGVSRYRFILVDEHKFLIYGEESP
ncbi:MAG: sulfatase [Akkermansiaceae bacterium]|nr:sulfatase [Akkermansiaceae bacterium]